jgi:dTDP-4-amino-4,6-dideoxygalactose transaminase
VPPGFHHVFHQYTIRVPDNKRDSLVEHLQKNEIGSGVYYPVPIHKQTYYTVQLGYNQSLPESERAAQEVLSLPVHPGLNDEELDRIVNTVNNFFKKT